MKKGIFVLLFTVLGLHAFASGHGLNALDEVFEILVVLFILSCIHIILSIISLFIRKKGFRIIAIIFGTIVCSLDFLANAFFMNIPAIIIGTLISVGFLAAVVMTSNRKAGEKG